MTTNTVSQKSNLDAALEYAKEGWPVLPLIGKRPLTEHGVKDATRDVGKITEWWTRYLRQISAWRLVEIQGDWC